MTRQLPYRPERSGPSQVLQVVVRMGEGDMVLRATEDTESSGGDLTSNVLPPTPVSLIAARLVEYSGELNRDLIYVALGEGAANGIHRSLRALARDVTSILLPPWDCLPYDRVAPSRQCMGRRMDALRVWSSKAEHPRILVTSLDAALQRIPPSAGVAASQHEVKTGQIFERERFERFVRQTGYLENGVVDEPGEVAFRDDVIDIFPAGGMSPMRIVLSEDGSVSELRTYDPHTQRTVQSEETMVFGPASEIISKNEDSKTGQSAGSSVAKELLGTYPAMDTIFDIVQGAKVAFADGTNERLTDYLAIIAEARDSDPSINQIDGSVAHSLYIDRDEFEKRRDQLDEFQVVLRGRISPDLANGAPLARRALQDLIQNQLHSGMTVVIVGDGKATESLCKHLAKESGVTISTVSDWLTARRARAGSCLRIKAGLRQSIVTDEGVSVVAVEDGLEDADVSDPGKFLAEPDLEIGDVVVHEDHGVAIMTALETVEIDKARTDAARLEYRDGASILVPMEEFGKIWRYGSEREVVSLDRLHTDAWERKKATVEVDLRKVARHLVKLAKARSQAKAKKYKPSAADFRRFVARFPYSETPDQQAAIDATLSDLASGKPMNRLICGDVGFGKTEIALRSAAAVAFSGGQVVVVCPTTVLARQHYTTFARRFRSTGIRVSMLSRIATASEIADVKTGLSSGNVQIVIATHAILAKDISFAKLGLVILDEEHRFGKRDKEALAKLSDGVHRLVMSATPIPQTLQAAMIGLQDVSILAISPSRRRPVRTSLAPVDEVAMRIALLREHRRGGQSFVVVPQIEDIEPLRALLAKIVPDLSVRVAHGKLPAAKMDEIMVGFADGDGDILLATNIIESGLDVPSANTIFVWRADRFGMAQLHQLRGRVGRGNAQGFAYLLTLPEDNLSEETSLRLSAMIEHDRLGAGLALSIQDLELRGGGDLVGDDQAGHLKVLGISLYRKLLERALSTDGSSSADEGAPTAINIGISGSIPKDYIPDPAVRLTMNAKLLRARTAAEIEDLEAEFDDRFGDLPDEVILLLRLTKLKVAAKKAGMIKIEGGPKGLAIEFASKPSAETAKQLSKAYEPMKRGNRLVFDKALSDPNRRLKFFEGLLGL